MFFSSTAKLTVRCQTTDTKQTKKARTGLFYSGVKNFVGCSQTELLRSSCVARLTVGCTPTKLLRSSFLAPNFIAKAKPCMISPTCSPTMCIPMILSPSDKRVITCRYAQTSDSPAVSASSPAGTLLHRIPVSA